VQANKAGLKALLINRIGDLGLLFALLLIYKYFRTVDFAVVFVLVPYFQEVNIGFFGLSINYLNSVCIFFVFGILGKSAQLGLHT
jgi:NADH:ubiquinone oxidoreductase subunit 5 (subunit L)/multisubunit Na+/H+ antiporter MnhA subunit